jgi:hypothetical protein
MSYVAQLGKEQDDRTRFGTISIARYGKSLLPGHDVVGGLESCVDPSQPRVDVTIVHRWQLEFERFPIGIEDKIKDNTFSL